MRKYIWKLLKNTENSVFLKYYCFDREIGVVLGRLFSRKVVSSFYRCLSMN